MSHSKNLEDWIFKSLGGLGILICMVSSIPQTYKMYKTRRTNDVSSTGIYILLMGTFMLEIYSYYFNLWEMFFPNIFTITGLIIQVTFKRCYDDTTFDRQLLSDTSEIVNITPIIPIPYSNSNLSIKSEPIYNKSPNNSYYSSDNDMDVLDLDDSLNR